MSAFEYEAPFTPTRSRKKRKNKIPQERPDPAVVLTRTIEELTSGNWISQCTRKLPRPIFPTTDLTDPITRQNLCARQCKPSRPKGLPFFVLDWAVHAPLGMREPSLLFCSRPVMISHSCVHLSRVCTPAPKYICSCALGAIDCVRV